MRYDFEVSPLTPHTRSRVSLRRLPFITSLPMENLAPSGERFWSSYFRAVSLPIPSLSSFSSLILFSYAIHSLHHCCAMCTVLVAAPICTTAVVSGVRKILQNHDKQIRDKLIATHYLSTKAREKYSCIRQLYSNDGVMALVASLQRSVLRERSLLRCGLCTGRLLPYRVLAVTTKRYYKNELGKATNGSAIAIPHATLLLIQCNSRS